MRLRGLIDGIYAAGRVYARLYQGLRIEAMCPLPPHGPGIVVCNHISGVDPLLVQAGCRRRLVWMMAKEYYELPSMRWFFQRIGAIPVERGGRDLSSTRAALRALRDGHVLALFPEGRIAEGEDILPLQPGAALLALRTGVCVYPAHLEGSNRGKSMLASFLTPASTRVRFGPPVDLSGLGESRSDVDEATARIARNIEVLGRKKL